MVRVSVVRGLCGVRVSVVGVSVVRGALWWGALW